MAGVVANRRSRPRPRPTRRKRGDRELGYGRQELVCSEKDNSYGLSLKSTVWRTDGNQRHGATPLLIVDRSNYSINLGRRLDLGLRERTHAL